ncbi:MAG: pstS1 [Eubacterium sp.]|jgi:phosphate transport system substrate-binding protein|nr:pstS1 [Eubacterium sp.]
MSTLKKVVSLMLVLTLTLTFCMAAFAAESGITLNLDGKKVAASVKPVDRSGVIYVPVKTVAETIGGSATLSGDKKSLTLKTSSYTTVLTSASKKITVNGTAKNLSKEVISMRGTFMISLGDLNTAIGVSGTYDKSSKAVKLKYFTDMTGTLKIGGSTTIQQYSQSVANKLTGMNKGLSIAVTGGGSGAGISGAADGTLNIGNASRDLKDAEKKDNPTLKSFTFGKDAICIIVNKDNTVKALKKDQVIKIFTGEITNWKDVGGSDAPILLQTREEGSGTLDGMMSLALGGETIAKTATPSSSNQLMAQAVKGNKNAIGFISMGYVSEGVKSCTIDGITATPANGLTGKYPYVRNLNVVTKGAPADLAGKYIDFMKTAEGQKMLSEEAYLPLNFKD